MGFNGFRSHVMHRCVCVYIYAHIYIYMHALHNLKNIVIIITRCLHDTYSLAHCTDLHNYRVDVGFGAACSGDSLSGS